MPSPRPASYRTLAKRRWPKAICQDGSGRYVVVSVCGGDTTIRHFAARADADEARRSIDKMGCGSRCSPLGHAVVDLGTLR